MNRSTTIPIEQVGDGYWNYQEVHSTPTTPGGTEFAADEVASAAVARRAPPA